MESFNKKIVQNLVIMKSPRLVHHRVIPIHKQEISRLILENCEFLSVDGSLQRQFLMCKKCHQVFKNSYANRHNLDKHLLEIHHILEWGSSDGPPPDFKINEVGKIKKAMKRGRPCKILKINEEPNQIPIEMSSPTLIIPTESLIILNHDPDMKPVIDPNTKTHESNEKVRLKNPTTRPKTKKSKPQSPFTFPIPAPGKDLGVNASKVLEGVEGIEGKMGNECKVEHPNGEIKGMGGSEVTSSVSKEIFHITKPKGPRPKKVKILDRDLLVTEKISVNEPSLTI